MAERVGVIAGIEGPRGFVERRLSGQTFAGSLVEYGSSHQGIDISQIQQGGGEDHFLSVTISRISEDRQHALAYGVDRDRTTLLRDGEPVLSADGDRLSVYAASADFSRIIAINGGGRKDVYLIFPDEIKQIMPGRHVNVLGYSEDLDRVLYSYYTPGDRKTTFMVFQDSEGGRTSTVFDVNGDFSEPKLIGASPDFLRIVWQGKATTFLGPQTSDTFVFDNDQFLGKGIRVEAFANEDVSRTLIFLTTGKTPWTRNVRVVIDGKEVFKQKGLIARVVKATPDLSAAAMNVGDEYNSTAGQLLIVRNGYQPQLSDRYDQLNSLEEADGGLRAVVTRNNIQYEIRVPGQ